MDQTMRVVTRAQRAAGVVATVLLVVLGLMTLQDFLPAIVWAVVFAIAIWPAYHRCERRWPPLGRVVLPVAFTSVVALVFILPLALIVAPLGREARDVAALVDQARRTGIPVPAFLSDLPFASHLIPLWRQYLSDPGQASILLGRIAQGGAIRMGGHFGSQVVHRTVLFGFTLLTLFFLFRDGRALSARMLVAARRMFGPAGETVGRQLVASVHGTVDGLVLVGLGEGVVLGLVYLLADVPRPVLFGVATAILSMVPFGAAIAFWAAGLLLLFLGQTLHAIVVVVAGLVVTFLADHFIRPTLIGSATRLPFLWVLFGILGGIETFGLVGLFVGPAVMAALILLWREWVGDERGPLNP